MYSTICWTRSSLLLLAIAISPILLTSCAMLHGKPQTVAPPQEAPHLPKAKPVLLMEPLPALDPPTQLSGLTPKEQAEAAISDYVKATQANGRCMQNRDGLIDWINRQE